MSEIVYSTRISCPNCKEIAIVAFGNPPDKFVPFCVSCKKKIKNGTYKGIGQKLEVIVGRSIKTLEEWDTEIKL